MKKIRQLVLFLWLQYGMIPTPIRLLRKASRIYPPPRRWVSQMRPPGPLLLPQPGLVQQRVLAPGHGMSHGFLLLQQVLAPVRRLDALGGARASPLRAPLAPLLLHRPRWSSRVSRCVEGSVQPTPPLLPRARTRPRPLVPAAPSFFFPLSPRRPPHDLTPDRGLRSAQSKQVMAPLCPMSRPAAARAVPRPDGGPDPSHAPLPIPRHEPPFSHEPVCLGARGGRGPRWDHSVGARRGRRRPQECPLSPLLLPGLLHVRAHRTVLYRHRSEPTRPRHRPHRRPQPQQGLRGRMSP